MKKLTTIIVCLMLFGVSVKADLLSGIVDKNDGITQITKGGTWRDPSSGTTYISGGNFHYKFKPATRKYPPLVKFGAPSAKASCSGISLDAGFISFLDGEQIKQMFSDAGKSAAYGLVLGLISSMPSISDTFDKINEWTRKIQELMGDVCGKMEEMSRNKVYGDATPVWSQAISDGDKKVAKWLQGGEDGIKKMVNEQTKKHPPKAEEQGDKIEDDYSSLMSLFGLIIGEKAVDQIVKDKNKGMAKITLEDILDKNNSVDVVSKTYISLLYLFIGEIGADQNAINDLEKFFDLKSAETTVNQTQYDEEQAAKVLGQEGSPKLQTNNPTIIPPEQSNINNLFDVLVNGGTNLVIKNRDIYFIKMQKKVAHSTQGNSSSDGAFNTKDNKKLIYKVIVKEPGEGKTITVSIANIKDGFANDLREWLKNADREFIFPVPHSLVNSIRLLSKLHDISSNKEPDRIDKLIETIAITGIYIYSLNLLDSIEGALTSSLKKGAFSFSDEAASKFNELIKRIQEIRKSLLDKRSNPDSKIKSVDNIEEELEDKIKRYGKKVIDDGTMNRQ